MFGKQILIQYGAVRCVSVSVFPWNNLEQTYVLMFRFRLDKQKFVHMRANLKIPFICPMYGLVFGVRFSGKLS